VISGSLIGQTRAERERESRVLEIAIFDITYLYVPLKIVSAKCGGWCGDCRNTEPIVLKAEVGSVTTTEPYTTETTTEATTEEPDYTTGYGSSSGGYFSTS
jgi:hypothetical protein